MPHLDPATTSTTTGSTAAGALSMAPAAPRVLPPTTVAFLQRLRCLPLGAWEEAGRRLGELDRQAGRSVEAELPLPPTERIPASVIPAPIFEVMERMPRLSLQLRRRIRDLAEVVDDFVPAAEVSRMRRAALIAAVAVTARAELDAQQFAEAYAPFSALIPLEGLDAGVAAPAAMTLPCTDERPLAQPGC